MSTSRAGEIDDTHDCTRRTFLQTGLAWTAGLGTVGLHRGAASTGGGHALGTSHRSALGAAARVRGSEPVLVVLQVRGGWDGLSMLVPAEDPAYHALRPQLAIRKELGLAVDGAPQLRWHPELAALRDVFDRGELAVVQNVSHPHPDLSHSESETKWHTADPAGEQRTGWLARYLLAHGGDDPLAAVTISELASHSFAGVDVPAFRDLVPLQLRGDAEERAAIVAAAAATSPATAAAAVASLPPGAGGAARAGGAAAADEPLATIARAMQRALAQSEALLVSGARYAPRASYPDTELGRDLQLAARLVTSNRRTRLVFVSTAGFDTHTQQCESSRPTVGVFAERLLGVGLATKAFLDDVRAHGESERVVVLLRSEFGRAAHENHVLGTEHGHGGLLLLAGAPVRGGLYGKAPDLAAIRDHPHATSIAYAIPFDARATDFRCVYATLLERWLATPSEAILHGRFAPLAFL